MIDPRLTALPSFAADDDDAREARHAVLASLLGAYADGELPAETVSQIDAHLLGCLRCRNEVRVQRALGARLANGTIPTASAAFQERIRRSIAAAPPLPAASPPVARVSWSRWRAAGLVVVVGLALVTWRVARRTSDITSPTSTTPVALAVAPTVLHELVGVYRTAARADLPGRARDLERVRQAVGFPVTPLENAEAHLVAVWTVTVDGELAAALAYRWRDQLVVQFVVSEASIFRARDLRTTFAARRVVALQDGDVGVLAWSEPRSGSVLLATQPWSALRTLAPTGAP